MTASLREPKTTGNATPGRRHGPAARSRASSSAARAALALWLGAWLGIPPQAAPLQRALNARRIGVYGADFEFTTLSVLKADYRTAARPERLRAYAEALQRNHRQGRFNLFGLYVAGRTRYERPAAKCLEAAVALVRGVGRRNLDAVFLSEENVPSHRGLAVLNGLYDGLKQRWPDLPVFQWLSAPLGPAPELKADGWVYDFYGRRRAAFRRKIVRYLVTGKPLVLCLNASPMVGRFETPAGATVTREQFAVCREFDLAAFFFCVDSRWGNPNIWRISAAPEIAAWRTWLLHAVDSLRRQRPDSGPALSADYVDGAAVEAAPDDSGRFVFEEDFAAPSFLEHWTVRGFRNIVWSARDGGCLRFRPRSRFFTGAELYCHIVSDFEMRNPAAALTTGTVAESAPKWVTLRLSATGHDWPLRAAAVRPAADRKGSVLALEAGDAPRFRSHEYWLQVRLAANSATPENPAAELRHLRFTCRITPPEKPGVRLRPDQRGTAAYTDRFLSRKYRWLARVSHGEALTWRPGRLSLGGIKGRTNRAVLVWPFSCTRPLHRIRVELEAQANAKNLGGLVRLALSRDGKHWSPGVDTSRFPADRSGWQRGALVLDTDKIPGFQGRRLFFVRVELVNNCGLETPASSVATRLAVTVDAGR